MAARTVLRAAAVWALALTFAGCREPNPAPDAGRDWPPAGLRSGGAPVAAALAPGEVHRYRLPLQRGQLLRLIVNQKGIDAVVALDDPAGTRVLEADRLINDRGPELVLAVAATGGVHTLVISGPEKGNPGRYEARIEALRLASESDRRSAAAYQLFTGAEGLEPEKAMERWTRALATWRELGEVALEAEALERIARQHNDQRNRPQAAALYREAADAFARAGDHRWEAICRTNLGANLLNLAEDEEAAEQYALALSLARRERDRLTEAKAFHGLGQAHQRQGELQEALDDLRNALALFPRHDGMRPHSLHELGVLYARYLHDERQGHDLLLEAWNTWSPGQDRYKATTSSQLGRLAYEQGRLGEASRYFEEALALQGKNNSCSAVVLARLSLVKEAQGARQAADARMAEALEVVRTASCLRFQPTVHLLGAGLAEKRGDLAGVRAGFDRSAALFAGLGDRLGRAESLAGLARAERALGDLKAARVASRQALEIVESVRPSVLREDLRTSFFSGARSWFDFHIDLLLQMGAGDEAWVTAEQARARSLGDLIEEAGAGLRRSAAHGLVVEERALQRRLNVLETRRLGTKETEGEKLQSLLREIEARIAELEALRGDIRRGSPLYASLVQPEPVSLARVRRELLDEDTVLLEYRLGEPESTVWAVTRDSLTAVRLPSRRAIEVRAREVAHGLSSVEESSATLRGLCELSRMLLAPVAPSLDRRRLVVVADGALELLPFAALPEPAAPCSQAPPLVEGHEVVSLPSAAALLLQRRLLAGRQPAPGWLALVADPVYKSDRLRGAKEEAEAIAALVPPEKLYVATRFAASRATVTGGALHGYRILHFAAHGTLNPEQPLLSALVLSQLDPAGRPVEGVLRAHEVYDLDLPAELVVLSACDTALGREVPGEGLVSGLPRAFLYAGAARALVSLWEVPDRSTRELMTHFYRGLFERGLAPAKALQEAQLVLRRQGLRPRDWAGFVLLGDWRPLPPFSR